MSQSLQGKVALITGAGGMRGIGRACALSLASEGADLVITDVDRGVNDLPPDEVAAGWKGLESVAEEVRSLGRRCVTLRCDLRKRDEIKKLVAGATKELGAIDILVNNARAIIGRDRALITDLDEDVWANVIAINTTAVFLTMKYAGAEMVRAGRGGRIINIASDVARQGCRFLAAYSASKFAVIGLTQSAALDLAPDGITVNSVCPGPVDSGRLSYWERESAEKEGVSLEVFRARIVADTAKKIPLGRIAVPTDVSNLVTFLASDSAAFITGQAYNVNGGQLFH